MEDISLTGTQLKYHLLGKKKNTTQLDHSLKLSLSLHR